MRNRSPLLNWSFAIAFFLVAQLVGGTRAKLYEPRPANHNIRCTIQVEDREWTPNAPAMVRGKIENLTDGSLELEVEPILNLSSKTSREEWDKYWAPVDLLRDGPLLVDKHAMDRKGNVIGIKPLPIKLTFNKKNESVDFRIDARHVLWEKAISSIWPSRELFAAVEPGIYSLYLVLGTKNGDIESADVEVVVGPKPSHKSKP